jgi:hypothetical protein
MTLCWYWYRAPHCYVGCCPVSVTDTAVVVGYLVLLPVEFSGIVVICGYWIVTSRWFVSLAV